jgi:hypothetical protein
MTIEFSEANDPNNWAAEQTKNFDHIFLMWDSEAEAKASAKTMRAMIDWVKKQGVDVYVRRMITLGADRDFEKDAVIHTTSFRGALLPSDTPQGREIRTDDKPLIGEFLHRYEYTQLTAEDIIKGVKK